MGIGFNSNRPYKVEPVSVKWRCRLPCRPRSLSVALVSRPLNPDAYCFKSIWPCSCRSLHLAGCMKALNAAAVHTRAKNARVNSNRDQALISTCIVATPSLAQSIESDTASQLTLRNRQFTANCQTRKCTGLLNVSVQRTANIGCTDGKWTIMFHNI